MLVPVVSLRQPAFLLNQKENLKSMALPLPSLKWRRTLKTKIFSLESNFISNLTCRRCRVTKWKWTRPAKHFSSVRFDWRIHYETIEKSRRSSVIYHSLRTGHMFVQWKMTIDVVRRLKIFIKEIFSKKKSSKKNFFVFSTRNFFLSNRRRINWMTNERAN